MYANDHAEAKSIRVSVDMKPPPFDYARAGSVEEAVALLAKHGDTAKIIAGGQSLMPMLAFRMAVPKLLVDIGSIAKLRGIDIDDRGVTLGALVRWCDIERNEALAQAQPLLVEAVKHVAHYQIRNRGTVGGSLAHADPAAEFPGIAVACEAEINVVGLNGPRTILAKDLFLDSLTTALAPDEVIVSARLPPWKRGRRWGFEEFARRRGDFALAGVALFYDLEQNRAVEPRVAAIGIGTRPVRLSAVERIIRGRAVDSATIREAVAAGTESIDPPGDIHAPGDYRRALIGVLLERALVKASGLTLSEVA
jgi:aerobic carbon-monoxide dehydrogenase medium subunit